MRDVVVIGAGAAGVGAATLLARRGFDVLVLERGEVPGHAWHERYEGLRLHTSRRRSYVAGAGGLGRGEAFVPATEFAEHVCAAASAAGLEVRCGVGVRRVRACAGEASGLLVETDGETVEARHVVIATGQNAVPVAPQLPGREQFAGMVIHAHEYRAPAAFAGQRVLVVGTGNTGTEIAVALAGAGAARVTVAMRSVPRIVPRRIGPFTAHSLAVLLTRLFGVGGMRRATAAIGRLRGRRLARLGLHPPTTTRVGVPMLDHGFVDTVGSGAVQLVGAVERFEPDGVRTSDGTLVESDAVIWATGYRPGALDLLDPDLRGTLADDDLADPAVLATRHVWFVGFGPAPVGQLLLAREHAQEIADAISRTR